MVPQIIIHPSPARPKVGHPQTIHRSALPEHLWYVEGSRPGTVRKFYHSKANALNVVRSLIRLKHLVEIGRSPGVIEQTLHKYAREDEQKSGLPLGALAHIPSQVASEYPEDAFHRYQALRSHHNSDHPSPWLHNPDLSTHLDPDHPALEQHHNWTKSNLKIRHVRPLDLPDHGSIHDHSGDNGEYHYLPMREWGHPLIVKAVQPFNPYQTSMFDEEFGYLPKEHTQPTEGGESIVGFHGTKSSRADSIMRGGFAYRLRHKGAAYGHDQELSSVVPGGYIARNPQQALGIAYQFRGRSPQHTLLVASGNLKNAIGDEDYSDEFLRLGKHRESGFDDLDKRRFANVFGDNAQAAMDHSLRYAKDSSDVSGLLPHPSGDANTTHRYHMVRLMSPKSSWELDKSNAEAFGQFGRGSVVIPEGRPHDIHAAIHIDPISSEIKGSRKRHQAFMAHVAPLVKVLQQPHESPHHLLTAVDNLPGPWRVERNPQVYKSSPEVESFWGFGAADYDSIDPVAKSLEGSNPLLQHHNEVSRELLQKHGGYEAHEDVPEGSYWMNRRGLMLGPFHGVWGDSTNHHANVFGRAAQAVGMPGYEKYQQTDHVGVDAPSIHDAHKMGFMRMVADPGGSGYNFQHDPQHITEAQKAAVRTLSGKRGSFGRARIYSDSVDSQKGTYRGEDLSFEPGGSVYKALPTDPTHPDPMAMHRPEGGAEHLYSGLHHFVHTRMKSPMNSDQLHGWLKGSGFSDDELNSSGIPHLQGKVTPQQVKDHIQAHSPAMRVTTLRQNPTPDPRPLQWRSYVNHSHGDADLADLVNGRDGGDGATQVLHQGESPLYAIHHTPQGQLLRLYNTRHGWTFQGRYPASTLDQMQHALVGLAGRPSGGTTKYETYSMPGGENYREDLIHAPKWGRDYHSVHWKDHPNVLAHLRMKDRVDADGKKTLTLEEVQSDWHQQGRSVGYSPEENAHKLDAVRDDLAKLSTRNKELSEKHSDWLKGNHTDVEWARANPKPQELRDHDKELDRLDTLRRSIEDGHVTSTSHKGQHWHELALKHALHQAVLGGYDRLSINPPEVQNGEYLHEPKEGQARHYGKTYPEYLDKLGRAYGTTAGKVHVGNLDTGADMDYAEDGQEVSEFPVHAHYIDITPAMREHITRHGMPLWGTPNPTSVDPNYRGNRRSVVVAKSYGSADHDAISAELAKRNDSWEAKESPPDGSYWINARGLMHGPFLNTHSVEFHHSARASGRLGYRIEDSVEDRARSPHIMDAHKNGFMRAYVDNQELSFQHDSSHMTMAQRGVIRRLARMRPSAKVRTDDYDSSVGRDASGGYGSRRGGLLESPDSHGNRSVVVAKALSALETAKKNSLNDGDSYCPKCGAIFEWGGESCNRCGTEAVPMVWENGKSTPYKPSEDVAKSLSLNTPLGQKLHSLRHHMVSGAQKIYDGWEAGHPDDEFGGGGICDRVSDHIGNVLAEHGIDSVGGGQDGDDHAFTIAHDDHHAYQVDIPHQHYERGGGYSWTKVPGIKFTPDHVDIHPIPRHWVESEDVEKAHSYTKSLRRAESCVNVSATEEQLLAGNARLGKFQWKGLTITIENPKGSIRRGKNPDKPWQVTMGCAYGYFNYNPLGRDGDPVDVFVCDDNLDSEIVFIVNQVNQSGGFDEHKVIIGCTNEKDARRAYLSCYCPGWVCGTIKAMHITEFKKWLASGKRGVLKAIPIVIDVAPKPRSVIIQKAVTPLDPEDIAPKGEYYHGSPHADNILREGFQSKYLGSGNDQWSPGHYFTNDKTLARKYTEAKSGKAPTGAGVVRVGLNIKKPIKLNSDKHTNMDDWPKLSPAHAHAMIHHATQSMTGEDDLSDWGDVSYEGRPKVLKTMVGMYSGGSPANLLYDVYGKDRLEEGLRKYSSLTGHDGVEISYPTGEKHTVAWFPEQIKVHGKF